MEREITSHLHAMTFAVYSFLALLHIQFQFSAMHSLLSPFVTSYVMSTTMTSPPPPSLPTMKIFLVWWCVCVTKKKKRIECVWRRFHSNFLSHLVEKGILSSPFLFVYIRYQSCSEFIWCLVYFIYLDTSHHLSYVVNNNKLIYWYHFACSVASCLFWIFAIYWLTKTILNA